MLGKYIINDRVIFDPEERSLLLTGEHIGSTSKLILHTPTSQCLALLIERHGDVLSQDELLELIWRKKGVVVSSSTVYQNISLLRRSLNQLGLYDDVIITVPRQGVTLSRHIKITLLAEQHADVRQQELLPAVAGDVAAPTGTTPISPSKGKKYLPGLIAGLSIALIMLCIGAFYLGHNNSSNYMDSYDLAPTSLSECHMYVNDNMPTGRLEYIVKNSAFDCATRPFNYVTAFAGVNRYSVISCVRDIAGARASCRSSFYLEGSK